jgi:hypothetical protein
MPETNTTERLRVLCVSCGLFLAIATGSLLGFVLDRAIAGHLWWLVVFGVVGYFISKLYERLRLAMGLAKTIDVSRRIPWFGDWEAWIFSLCMGSFTLMRELNRGRSAGLAALFGVGGTFLMLAIVVSTSRLLAPAKGKGPQVHRPRA